MIQGYSSAQVINLADVRARKSAAGISLLGPQTLIVQAVANAGDGEAHRQIGISDAATVRELVDVVGTAFGFDPAEAPVTFTHNHRHCDAEETLHEIFRTIPDQAHLHWGLWHFSLHAATQLPREKATPWALCVGGSGSFAHIPFDIAAINARLTGTETTAEVLAQVNPEVRDFIERGHLGDLVPLLQALDLCRDLELDETAAAIVSELPYEDDQFARDCFWAVVIAKSCMVSRAFEVGIAEELIAELGWVDPCAKPLKIEQIEGMARASLSQLADLGAAGADMLAPVDRLEIYRALIRSQAPYSG